MFEFISKKPIVTKRCRHSRMPLSGIQAIVCADSRQRHSGMTTILRPLRFYALFNLGLTISIVAAIILGTSSGAGASDNELTAKEKKAGWLLVFDGTTLNGWMTSSQTPSKVPVED